jgi:hypothetical protein
MRRRTLIVDSAFAANAARTRAARERLHGLQIMSIDQAAARLAGGFAQRPRREQLQEIVQEVLHSCDLGDLRSIQRLPGMARAATTTLMRAWDSGIRFDGHGDSRRQALAKLEKEVVKRLRPAMLTPPSLAECAQARVDHAPAVLGDIEFLAVPDLAPVWQPLVRHLSQKVKIAWSPSSRPVPEWLEQIGVQPEPRKVHEPQVRGVSCANPRHEAIEAMRWARELIADGQARPEEIAIAAASPAEWDAHLMAMSRDANLPVYFAHGRPSVSRGEGQVCAALAETILNGVTQDRVRRLVPLLRSQCGELQELPANWTRVLPRDAPLTSYELWRHHLGEVEEWPDGVDFSEPVLAVIEQVSRGPEHAEEVGASLLNGVSRSIWRQALTEGPPHALDVTLQGLRLPDEVDPAAAIAWGPAATIASAPRPFTRMIGLTSRSWPRTQGEDPLLPDHIVPQAELDPFPVPVRDQRDFRALLDGAGSEVVLSHSRRGADGRQLGISPLWPDSVASTYLERSRIAEHVMSESDRLLARREEFGSTHLATTTRGCWIDWHTKQVTAHDGLVQANHPLIAERLQGTQSTGALQRLLRDPIGYVWADVLGWREPSEDEEPIMLDALQFGALVHGVFEDATRRIESGAGIARASEAEIRAAAAEAAKTVAAAWEEANPVPPRLIWRRLVQRAEEAVPAGFGAEFGPNGPGALPDQRSLAEVPFGQAGWRNPPEAGREPPWDVETAVTIPGTSLLISGRIDRLDIAGDGSQAAVADYKTGKNPPIKKPPQVRGGKELQRCLYAFAVKSLLGGIAVDARLVYPLGDRVVTLADPEGTLDTLAGYLELGRNQLLAGNALPGEGTEDDYNDLSFALPGDAKDRYFRQKRALFNARHGELVDVWGMQ